MRDEAGRSLGPTCDTDFEYDLLSLVPALKCFAKRLVSGAADAEDLVQETLVKALGSSHRFAPGTNMKSWVFTIMKNYFTSEYRKRQREPNLGDPALFDHLVVGPEQEWVVRQSEMIEALSLLPKDTRETVWEVAMGSTYDEAAAAHGCEVGTVKSRLSRARSRLAITLGDLSAENEFGAYT